MLYHGSFNLCTAAAPFPRINIRTVRYQQLNDVQRILPRG